MAKQHPHKDKGTALWKTHLLNLASLNQRAPKAGINILLQRFTLPPEPSYYKRVSTVHEHGGYGSTGYRAPWSHEESSKLLLRTHTTASSTFMLYKLAARCRGEEVEGDENEFTHGAKATPNLGETSADDGFRPAKLFSIDRVFRNETMDATHLAEFHQVEGVVADRGLTLADLIGFMRVFFKKMGIEKVRFKPAYNPYTEPSLEISLSIPCSTNGSRSATVIPVFVALNLSYPGSSSPSAPRPTSRRNQK
ncbi:tRNA synthetases class II core domain (F)-domain-containing protein [Lentinula edodes]|uniref:tRNA synthetases class II core domain (F)-domain-containing protein n=1 Tax=Lentinula edodes TaxID=5353 RepID=UPI001E8CA08E|nr:tRNA synthetases class II core domain (F)-domain-containing protein [Lentinula edodes]KAH7868095.1 tRNA synthetases class II core domain (F)-domain-containing protein [Lentinula edodes]